ncbi:methyl-accepting chemotaxis protein [Sporomusa malonica]|uniref:Methyl-accepting chemotaxis protein n=1 Tax=Sporomusa malonica TaxID=112901 RepID=A0A1W2DQQ7_9FIRM|nr:HAMP domain-containing methyl-accepting chemotaxis protein [Sporomusa malonica]SMC99372.1 methyl-accepting chemotaxis protein [Sporomusa malonica]
MKRMTIGTQLSGMFGIVIVILVVLLGVTIYQFQVAAAAYQNMLTGSVTRTVELLKAQDNFHSGLADTRGYLAYGAENYANSAIENYNTSLEAVTQFTAGVTSLEARREGEKLQVEINSYVEDSKKVFALKRANDPGLGTALSALRDKTVIVDKQFQTTFDVQNTIRSKRIEELNANQNLVLKTVIGLGVAIIVVAVVLVVWYSRNLARRVNVLRSELIAVSNLDISTKDVHATRNDEIGDMAEAVVAMKNSLRDIVSNVRHGADMLAASSEELTSTVEEQLRTSEVIANATGEIAAGSSQNTNNITEISAVIEEVTAGAEQISASAAEVNNTALRAATDANQGMQLIQRVVSQNDTIEKSMKDITEVAASLVDGSGKIQEIVTVISSIAGQTNLLALNAAIEAARAGDAGRGFAVVAEEVRKLAEQSAGATNHIGEIIRKMTADIDFSVSVVSKANTEVEVGKLAAADTQKGFENIVDKLGQVQSGMAQISQAVAETAKGMQVVVANVQNIGAVAEETNASTQTVAAAAEEQNASLSEVNCSAEALAKMATELNEAIRRFKV